MDWLRTNMIRVGMAINFTRTSEQSGEKEQSRATSICGGTSILRSIRRSRSKEPRIRNVICFGMALNLAELMGYGYDYISASNDTVWQCLKINMYRFGMASWYIQFIAMESQLLVLHRICIDSSEYQS